MGLDPVAYANAQGGALALFYLAQSFVHTLNLSPRRPQC
jgi:hypothetical protein